MLAVNKPRGWLVHGPGSMEDAVRLHLEGRPASLSFRPGPVHRLDRNTSGLILFAASLPGASTLSALLREGRVDKLYLAVLDGRLERPAVWADELERDPARLRSGRAPGGKAARTEVTPVRAAARPEPGGLQAVQRAHPPDPGAGRAGRPPPGGGPQVRRILPPARLPAARRPAAAGQVPSGELGFRELAAPLFPTDEARLRAIFGRRAPEEAGAALDPPARGREKRLTKKSGRRSIVTV